MIQKKHHLNYIADKLRLHRPNRWGTVLDEVEMPLHLGHKSCLTLFNNKFGCCHLAIVFSFSYNITIGAPCILRTNNYFLA